MLQPVVQIQQTFSLIGLQTTPSSWSITQPKAELEITTSPGEWRIRQASGELTIDQSQARAAITGGTYSELSQRIYSGIEQLWLQGIAKRMEQGERMANIQNQGNTIAEVYGNDWQPVSFPETRAPASIDNVRIHYRAKPVEIQYRKAEVSIQFKTYQPEINFTKANLDIYLRQKPSLSFIPPELDIQM